MATRTAVSNRLIYGGRTPLSFPTYPEYNVPLKTNIFPLSWLWAITYTRPSIATVTDNEWVIREVLTWEIRYKWARRVRNGILYSQALNDPSWLTWRSTVTLDTQTINWIPVFRLINDAVMGTHLISKNVSFSFVAWNKYILSCIAKAGTSNYIQLLVATGVSTEYVNFDLSTGTATAWNTTQAKAELLSDWFYRISLSITAVASWTFWAFYSVINSASASRSWGYSWAWEYICLTATQFEDVTGQSIQTVWEYVSTNVLTAFPFHWSGVDGVKCFDTTLTGAKIDDSILDGFQNEGWRTNLFLQSNNFTVTWAKNAPQLVITPNAAIWPDGAMSMTKLSPGAGASLQSIVGSVAATAAFHTYTVYARAWENRFLQLLTAGTLSAGYVNFDLLTGTVWASSLWTGIIEPVDWFPWLYRCIATTDILVATTAGAHIHQVPTSTTGRAGNVSGNGTDWLYIWWAQFELWLFASSYIPTTIATVPRSPDYLTYNAINVISNFGTVYAEVKLNQLSTVDRRAISLSGNNNNRFLLRAADTSNNRAGTLVWNGSAVLTIYQTGGGDQTRRKMAADWTNGGVSDFYMNGVKYGTVSWANVIATQIDIGSTSSGSANLFGTIRNVKIWKSARTDAEMLALTTL